MKPFFFPGLALDPLEQDGATERDNGTASEKRRPAGLFGIVGDGQGRRLAGESPVSVSLRVEERFHTTLYCIVNIN